MLSKAVNFIVHYFHVKASGRYDIRIFVEVSTCFLYFFNTALSGLPRALIPPRFLLDLMHFSAKFRVNTL